MAWRPRRASSLDLDLPLSAEAGFVLAQLDGRTDLDTLSDVTGFTRDELDGILEGLLACGAVEPESGPAPSPPARAPERPPARSAPELPQALDEPPDAGPRFEEPEAHLDEHEVSHSPSSHPGDHHVTHRALWHNTFSALDVDARVGAVSTASEDELLALAYDPDPRVVRALLEHPRVGLAHARLVAAHHHTGAGLDAVVSRADFAADTQVLRALLKNPELSEGQLQRIAGSKPLVATYRLAADRDVHERSRARLRSLLLRAFARATSEERADLVWSTEGRCLAHLTGAAFDGRMTQLLSSRPIAAALLVQNLAKFRGTPPVLLVHLLRQPFVRNSPGLRKLVLAHPNTPNDERRKTRT